MTRDLTFDADTMKESHEYHLHQDSNTIFMDSDSSDNEVDPQMARSFVKNLVLLESAIADEASDDTLPITVRINTPGGDVVAGMAIFDAIQACPVKIVGYVQGQACSMGCVILQAFKERILAPNAFVMYHSGSTGVGKPSQEFPNAATSEIAYNNRVDDLVFARVLERQPTLTRNEFDVAVMRGLYFHDPKDAVAYGLADRVGAP